MCSWLETKSYYNITLGEANERIKLHPRKKKIMYVLYSQLCPTKNESKTCYLYCYLLCLFGVLKSLFFAILMGMFIFYC